MGSNVIASSLCCLFFLVFQAHSKPTFDNQVTMTTKSLNKILTTSQALLQTTTTSGNRTFSTIPHTSTTNNSTKLTSTTTSTTKFIDPLNDLPDELIVSKCY